MKISVGGGENRSSEAKLKRSRLAVDPADRQRGQLGLVKKVTNHIRENLET